MVNCNLLKAEIVKAGYTQKEFCQKIKMAPSTFIRKMRTGEFKTSEADAIIDVLSLKNPSEIFFAERLT